MTPEAVARAYVACVELEDRARIEAPELIDDIEVLRGELHALLLETFRVSGVSFSDRADAARRAFELVRLSSAIKSG